LAVDKGRTCFYNLWKNPKGKAMSTNFLYRLAQTNGGEKIGSQMNFWLFRTELGHSYQDNITQRGMGKWLKKQ